MRVLCCLCACGDLSAFLFLGAKRWHLWGSSLPENWVHQALEEPAQILGASLEQAFSSSQFTPTAKLLIFS